MIGNVFLIAFAGLCAAMLWANIAERRWWYVLVYGWSLVLIAIILALPEGGS